MLVSYVMTSFPAYIRLGATIRRAAEMISVSEVGHLMVLDHDGRFVGSLSEEDVVRAMLPGFDDVTAAGGTLADAFRLFLGRRSNAAGDVAGLIARVNQALFDASSEDRYATFFYGQYDPATLKLTYVNAGPAISLPSPLTTSSSCMAMIGSSSTTKYRRAPPSVWCSSLATVTIVTTG